MPLTISMVSFNVEKVFDDLYLILLTRSSALHPPHS